MAKARDIGRRMSSVESTRKITRTMEMVATSKLRRAQLRVRQARPFADRLTTVVENLVTPELADLEPLNYQKIRYDPAQALWSGDDAFDLALEHLDAEVMRLAWESLVLERPRLHGSSLEISHVSLRIRCRKCSHVHEPEDIYGMLCPLCNSAQPEILRSRPPRCPAGKTCRKAGRCTVRSCWSRWPRRARIGGWNLALS